MQLRQYGAGQWYDHWQHVSRVRHVLMAHRTPYALFEWLTRQTARLWRAGVPELTLTLALTLTLTLTLTQVA